MSTEAQLVLALIKSAEGPVPTPDLSGQMGQLEVLRQNVAGRNQLMREGAAAGGARAGGTGGGVLGAGGGLMAALKALSGGRGSLRTKAVGGGISSMLGALGGGMMGSNAGRRIGQSAVPDLPAVMKSPVNLQSTPGVIDHLAKAAADADGIIARMMEKQAAPLGALGRGLSGLMGAGKAVASRPFTLPGAGGGRGLSASRMATTAGLGGGAAIGGQHMANAAQNTVGRSMNPFTWADPQNEQQVFDRNLGQANAMKSQHEGHLSNALASHDFEGAGRMQGELDTGNFGQSSRLGRIFNPFTSQQSARSYADTARGVQGADHGKYDQMKGNMDRWGSKMPGDSRQRLQSQMDELKKRYDTNVPFPPEAGPAPAPAPAAAAPQPTGGGGTWSPGRRPVAPGAAEGWALNPNDYRQRNYWEPAYGG